MLSSLEVNDINMKIYDTEKVLHNLFGTVSTGP